MRIHTITGTTNPERSSQWWRSWRDRASDPRLVTRTIVWNGAPEDAGLETLEPHVDFGFEGDNLFIWPEYLGTVPAFLLAARRLEGLLGAHDIVLWIHDDVKILEQDWDLQVRNAMRDHNPLLAGFFGATGLGDQDIHLKPYNPMQLARQDCWSNLINAEAHGQRRNRNQFMPCVVFDGFSQIFPAHLLTYYAHELAQLKIVHHAYDAAMGIAAAKLAMMRGHKHDARLIPVSCRHAGGQTAVGDAGYNEWAGKVTGQAGHGDQALWEQAHAATYEYGRGILPLRVR